MFELRDRLYKYVVDRTPMYSVPLCINTNSNAYGEFARLVILSLPLVTPSYLFVVF
jgi:hypothetical protein